MEYRVINRFQDADTKEVYNVGDKYPRNESKPSKKRIETLSKKHPGYGVAFIEEVEKPKGKQPPDKE